MTVYRLYDIPNSRNSWQTLKNKEKNRKLALDILIFEFRIDIHLQLACFRFACGLADLFSTFNNLSYETYINIH